VVSAYPLPFGIHPALTGESLFGSARRSGWLHEIKHTAIVLLVLRDGGTVRLYARDGQTRAELVPGDRRTTHYLRTKPPRGSLQTCFRARPRPLSYNLAFVPRVAEPHCVDRSG
jgi:hypothetical protein